jgi:hypothetical protein
MMNKQHIKILASIMVLLIPLMSTADDLYQPFVAEQYSQDDFKISQVEYLNGNTVIRIIEAKNISKKYDKYPYFCRAWLDIMKEKQTLFRRYFIDTGDVPFIFGLFVPEVQPPAPFFAVVKNGNDNGRLFLVHDDGEVFDLIGGFYFITENRRYLFSHYAGAGSGLAVFDLQEGRVVFSSDKLPAFQHQWYVTEDASYYFTESEWPNGPPFPSEKLDVAYFFDFRSNKIIKKSITKKDIEACKPVAWDFDPRDCDECIVTHNSLQRSAQRSRRR